MDLIALDIETIPLEKDPNFDNPEHWAIFAVALGHYSERTSTVVDVLFRDNPGLHAERVLLNNMIDWIAERTHGKARTILSYNGKSYDLPILQYRAYELDEAITDSNLTERLNLLMETSHHTDLIKDMKDRKGYYVSLDDALDEFSIKADEPEWLGKKITGADMPSMGLELLAERAPSANDDLREAVRRYASSDVAPLFELYDELSQEKQICQ